MPGDMTKLEARLRALEDIEEIRTLRYWYGHHSNLVDGRGGDVDAFSALFCDDAEWAIGFGTFRGRAAIKAGLQAAFKQEWLSVLHFMLNPLITVNGDRAHGTWSGLFPFISKRNPRPVWGAVIYHDDYVRTDQGWKFQSIRIDRVFQSPEYHAVYGHQGETDHSSA